MSADSTQESFNTLMPRLRRMLSARFSLLHDMAGSDRIDEELRAGVPLTGATPWILMFAIFVASIGLNVNSTAVVIGAMLISPLMGPIMAVGYGVGIYDFDLIRKALVNLGIAALLGLVTSTLYFALTPLREAQSELLARTTPTIWDVLIAFFGGLAGIVGATRQEKSNVIPGVAIATALMPPLCTAGFGLARLQPTIFFGAAYLFSINCVFIAAATTVVVRFLRRPRHKFVDSRTEGRVKNWLLAVTLFTALPSLYLAWHLVGNEVFRSAARQFVSREFQFDKTHVLEQTITPVQRKIELTLIGDHLDQPTLQIIESHLAQAGLTGATLIVHQSGEQHLDVTSLRAGLLQDLYRDSQAALQSRDAKIQQLEQSLTSSMQWQSIAPDVARELQAQYPQIHDIVVGEGMRAADDGKGAAELLAILSASASSPLGDDDRKKIENWFRVRTKAAAVRLFIDAPPAPSPEPSAPPAPEPRKAAPGTRR